MPLAHTAVKIIGGYCFVSGLVSTSIGSIATFSTLIPSKGVASKDDGASPTPSKFKQLLLCPLLPINLSCASFMTFGLMLLLDPALPSKILQ